ncbi:hypothetical protein QM565_19515 [Geitlerinema splendidum]|nr:hypothetical protein [Geitlerinema splendidum]
MTHFKYLLIVGTVVFFPFHSSWGMDDLEQEVAGTSTSAGPSLSVREITKQGFFAKYGDDIRMIKPVPRPGPSFSLVDLEPEKLANLQTYDPAELEKEDFLIFHGVNFNSFNVDGFNKLYGDYIGCQKPTLTQMLLGGLWANLCMSASLIHPSKSPTWSAYGLTLRVPYPLIYLADYEDIPRTTHSGLHHEVRTYGDHCITNFNRRGKIVSREQCLRDTKANWHNEIQFVPEAVINGIPYSVTVTGLWARDIAEEITIEQFYYMDPVPKMEIWHPRVASPEELTILKEMSEELGIPLILSSEWEKK